MGNEKVCDPQQLRQSDDMQNISPRLELSTLLRLTEPRVCNLVSNADNESSNCDRSADCLNPQRVSRQRRL